MDLTKALADLREQRENLDRAILSLERLAGGLPRRRGRPPGRPNSRPKTRPPARAEGEHRGKAASE